MNKKTGVFLSRMQPLHIGHLGIIEKAIQENEQVIIIIGSKNKKDIIRNPLDIQLRRIILEEALEEKFTEEDRKRIIISELPDWTMETDIASNLEWGRYLYYNIVSLGQQKKFTFYFSDDKKIIEDWFEDMIKERITFRLFQRNNMFEAVSSTKIRNAFLDSNKTYIEESCPEAVIKRFDIIKETIEEVYKNPKSDYIMEE